MAITTLLFDCDNTLVLSEDLAFEACAELINEICAARGVAVSFTGPALMTEFVGQNFRGMLLALQRQHRLSLTSDELEAYVRREEDAVIARLKAALEPCVGVVPELDRLEREGSYTLAVVSSSAKRRVLASIEKVGMARFFPGDRVFSAATSLETPTSKPDPAIYLHAMESLGKRPEECVAVEDSRSGTMSATRAGIRTIGYVGPYVAERRTEMEGLLGAAGARAIMRDWVEFPACLESIEKL